MVANTSKPVKRFKPGAEVIYRRGSERHHCRVGPVYRGGRCHLESLSRLHVFWNVSMDELEAAPVARRRRAKR